MSATAIFFNGQRINIPGAYSRLDTSGLEPQSPAAVGIVALLGTAEGGVPLSVAPEDSDHTGSSTLDQRYRAGSPLRTAGKFAFQPSPDPSVPNGAQRIVAVKVNPATQSAATFQDALAVDSLILTSKDYGLFTTQINIEIAAGSVQGKKATVVFEDTTEEFDNLGGDPILNLDYIGGANGYTTATANFSTTDFRGSGVVAKTGLSAERTADIPAPGVLNYVSSNAGDTTQKITVYGLSGTTPVSETITLNGTMNVIGTQSFSKVLGTRKDVATAGTVTISNNPITTTLFTMTNVQSTRGLSVMTNMPIVPASSTFAIDVGVGGTSAMIVTQSAGGLEILQRFDVSTNAPAALTGAGVKVLYLVLGDNAVGRTFTLTARIFTLLFSTYPTVQKAVDALNALDGMTANATASAPTTFKMSDADRAAAISILSVVANFYADLFAIVDTINSASQLVVATRSASPNGNLVPANTVSPVYLTGGIEGVVTLTQWQQAFALLKKRRVNTIVVLTNDPAVASLLQQHLRDRAGTLRSEANGYFGIGTNGGAGETRANIKSQIIAMQSRSISAISQEVKRNDPDTGVSTWWPPLYHAAIAAGAQAGSAIAEPLTHKLISVDDVRNDPSWTVEDDSSEMIDAGLMIAEKRDGLGIRWVRSVTTYRADDNPIFTEMSSNESADQFAYQFRSKLEQRIGKKALAGSPAAIKSLGSDEANRLVDAEIIAAWRNLQVDQIGDVDAVSIEVAPVEPTNFIPITIHLTRFSATA